MSGWAAIARLYSRVANSSPARTTVRIYVLDAMLVIVVTPTGLSIYGLLQTSVFGSVRFFITPTRASTQAR